MSIPAPRLSPSINIGIVCFASVTHLPSNEKEITCADWQKQDTLQILFQDTCGAYQNDIPSRNKYNR